MTFHSRRKIRPMKSVLINVLYRLGVRPTKMVDMFNGSRATIYRHIKRKCHDREGAVPTYPLLKYCSLSSTSFGHVLSSNDKVQMINNLIVSEHAL